MNVEIGTEAAQFPEKEYIIGIALAVWDSGSKISNWKGSSLNLKYYVRLIQFN
jgi:hypothetical protein